MGGIFFNNSTYDFFKKDKDLGYMEASPPIKKVKVKKTKPPPPMKKAKDKVVRNRDGTITLHKIDKGGFTQTINIYTGRQQAKGIRAKGTKSVIKDKSEFFTPSGRPDFKKWDNDIAFKVTEKKEEKEKDKFDEEFKIVKNKEEFNDPWEQALFRICFTSPRYRSRVTDISKFLNYLDKEILSKSVKKEDQGDFIAEIINKTTVTRVTATDDAQNQAAKPYQKTVFKDFDGMIKILNEKSKISEKTEKMLTYVYDYLYKNASNNIFFKFSPSFLGIKKDGKNYLVIKSGKSFVDIYHSGDEEDVKYLENYVSVCTPSSCTPFMNV